MYRIREVNDGDLDRLLEMAKTVNFINLPPHEDKLRERVDESRRAFDVTRFADAPPADDVRADRSYMFVLEHAASGKCVGTSSIQAGMGSPEHPNLSFQLVKAVRQSKVLSGETAGFDLIAGRVEHIFARLFRDGSSPTEMGGLLLPPEQRGGGLGKLLSWVRFHYIKRHRAWFADRILAEMMAHLETYNDGNPFWRHVVRKFINIPYEVADRLSTREREFMYALLPNQINLSLMPDDVLGNLGRVNEITEPAKKLLQQIGFQYQHRIDPFDAGPHLEANTDDISVIRETRRCTVDAIFDPAEVDMAYDPTKPAGDYVPEDKGARCLFSTERAGQPMQAANGRFRVVGVGVVQLAGPGVALIGIEPGETVWLTPYDIAPEAHLDETLPTVEMPSGLADPSSYEAVFKPYSWRGMDQQ